MTDAESSTGTIVDVGDEPAHVASPAAINRHGSGASTILDPTEQGEFLTDVDSRKLHSSVYKGVVPQPNGRWGSQIYEKHRRVWLGTFDTQEQAARTYDVAVQRFRGRDAVTNFRPLSAADPAEASELLFIHSRTKGEIVDMLRKHTYDEEFRQGRHSTAPAHGTAVPPGCGEQLFEKVVTPSDVGKLNRLVIPKQHAKNYLPKTQCKDNNGVLVSMEDPSGKVWKFRYSYWNSSQSYVLTRGWSRFVSEKGLQAGDVVVFRRSVEAEGRLYIDCRKRREVRLFGVSIGEVKRDCGGGGGGKRKEVDGEFLDWRSTKKWLGLGNS